MKQALISSNEQVSFFDGSTGLRIAEVVDLNNTFEVYQDLVWVTCPNEVTAEDYYYSDGEFKLIPKPPKPFKTPVETLGN